jgi:hypothetical protein
MCKIICSHYLSPIVFLFPLPIIHLQALACLNIYSRRILHNVDVSSSSEAESIKELKETVEEQNKQFPQIQDTTASTAKDLDSSEEAEDTDSSK